METPLTEEVKSTLQKLSAQLQIDSEKLEQFIQLSNQLLLILENNLSSTSEQLQQIIQNGGENEKQQNSSDVRSLPGS